ncbi:MAG: hypothetical protein HOO96_35845 [Polyangiaceae bacterium]|nr:hypothetical protein [Polyangiaceae bacterium]
MEKTWPGEFTRLLPWGKDGDRKNDGLLRTRRMLFQCYAPNELKAAAAVAKIKDDFAGALTHWRAHFDTWVFVHNSRQGLGPQIVTALRDLGQKHAPLTVEDWGYEELRQQTFALSEADLSSLFGPAPTRRKMISLGLEELAPVLDQIARLPPPLGLDLRPVPADKLQRNMLSPSVQTLLTAGMSRADLVRKFFRLKPNLQDQIAESFRARYAELRKDHAPDAIFRELQRFAGGDSVLEPGAQEAVLAALAFFFEECDIFERPPSLEAP